jgi:polysaccharide export outer membrane protein
MQRDPTTLPAVVMVLVVVAGACSAPSPAPVSPPPTPVPTTGSVMPEWASVEEAVGPGIQEYKIAAGDVIDVVVFGHSDMRKELPVRPDGKIAYLLVGEVQAEGLSIDELQQDLEERLATYLRYPRVDVILKKAKEARFTILGAVGRPGVYSIKGPTTLLDGVAMAQGLSQGQYEGSTIEIADLENAFVVRRGKVVPVNFERAIHRGDTRHNILVEDGDYVYIPSSLAQEVFVLGEVGQPRSYGFRGRVTLMEAVAESGGFTDAARLGDVVILRGLNTGADRQLIPVDVKEIVAGRRGDMELEVGDVVYVPRSRLRSFADAMRDILSLLLVYTTVDSITTTN